VTTADGKAERAWVERWKRAGAALARLRARELRALSDETALAAAQELLSDVLADELPPWRRDWSGLVDWQRALHRHQP